ncbi:hypothetical protein ACIQGO_30545 [Streptomyces shenzhenensis]|uniref:hypothetical protein n=1 Tax=Streptomyces shenzhenensis TaxID=943815 RepID=UPI003802F52E
MADRVSTPHLQQGRIPVRSLKGSDPVASEVLRDMVYLDELDRQAGIVNNNIVFAWRRAAAECSPTDAKVWSALQAALFAAIIVQRILYPGSVHQYPHHKTQKESRDFARRRGQRLRDLLGEAADAEIIRLTKDVRDPFEHVDERLDQLMTPDAIALSDWYISTGRALLTPETGAGSTGYGLRVFYPEGGFLYFGREKLDLYVLDLAMLRLRAAIGVAQGDLQKKIRGRNLFGGSQLVDLLPEGGAHQRAEYWLAERQEFGHGLTHPTGG